MRHNRPVHRTAGGRLLDTMLGRRRPLSRGVRGHAFTRPVGRPDGCVRAHSQPLRGPLTWQPTAQTLADRGHIVVTPALNFGNPRPPYWSHYASYVAAAARGVPEREPLVLVAHSAAA